MLRFSAKGTDLKQQLRGKLIEHKNYIRKNGEAMPEIRSWKWNAESPVTASRR